MHENQTPSLINDHPEADIPVYFAIAISSKLAENKRRHKKIQIVLVLAFVFSMAPALTSVARWSLRDPLEPHFQAQRVGFIL